MEKLLTDYEKGLEAVKNIPKVYLGQEVQTPFGKGIIVEMEMDFNGLYIRPEVASVIVWFSTRNSKNGWVTHSFRLNEITVNYRKLKLIQINDTIHNISQ